MKGKMTSTKNSVGDGKYLAFDSRLYPRSIFISLSFCLMLAVILFQKLLSLWLYFRHEFTDWQVLDAFIWLLHFNLVPCKVFR